MPAARGVGKADREWRQFSGTHGRGNVWDRWVALADRDVCGNEAATK